MKKMYAVIEQRFLKNSNGNWKLDEGHDDCLDIVSTIDEANKSVDYWASELECLNKDTKACYDILEVEADEEDNIFFENEKLILSRYFKCYKHEKEEEITYEEFNKLK